MKAPSEGNMKKPARRRKSAVAVQPASTTTTRRNKVAEPRIIFAFRVGRPVVVGGYAARPGQVLLFFPTNADRIIGLAPKWPDVESEGALLWSNTIRDVDFIQRALLALSVAGSVCPIAPCDWDILVNKLPPASVMDGHSEFA